VTHGEAAAAPGVTQEMGARAALAVRPPTVVVQMDPVAVVPAVRDMPMRQPLAAA
jgi:hypothetical protein